VDAAHQAEMMVIIDWVANHTAWDHVWTAAHPERFTQGPDGGFIPPNPGWSDVIDLNFDTPGTRAAMTDAMVYWVREFEVDGFRCDVADDVPRDFWKPTIEALRRERPVFMLAEADSPWMHQAGFEATYGWKLSDALINAARGEVTASQVRQLVEKDVQELGTENDAFRMLFTSNHDWNSWNGIASERLGPAWEAATVLTFTLPGMPLIYSGEEAGLDKQLEFFEKDPIEWRQHPAADLYTRLCKLKRANPALHHGAGAGRLEFLGPPTDTQILAFKRTSGEGEIIVVANLSATPADLSGIALEAGARFVGLTGHPDSVPEHLEPWGWRVLIRTD
jgi:glycosidase